MIARHSIGLLAFGLIGGLGCNQGGQAGQAASPGDNSQLTAEQEQAAQAAALLVATEIALAFDAEVAAEALFAVALDEEAALRAESERDPDVIYVPTPEPVVDRMLELAAVNEHDVVYDLGCGDGRIVITAAQRYGVKAWGFDIDPVRVAEARANAKAAGVEDLVTIEQKDIFSLDLSPASVVTLYLLPELNVRLIPQLEQLKPGSRIVSHDFDMEGVTPITHETMKLGARDIHQIFLWRTPFEGETPKLDPTAPAPSEPPATVEPPLSSETPALP
jgi:SAM-dependent methyltransferase